MDIKKGEYRKCLNCDKENFVNNWRFKRGKNFFCNKKCYGEYLSKYKTGDRHPSYKKIKRICKHCGKEFYKNPYTIKKGWGIFCSNICKTNYQKEKYKGENNPQWKGGKIKRICLICNKEFFVKRHKVKENKGKCCSKKCSNIYKSEQYSGEKSHSWRGGISFEPYIKQFNRKLKRIIRKRDGYICQVCNKPNSKDVHHIDYNKKNCNESNLITLCRSCHSKTCRNREYWELKLSILIIAKYGKELI